MARQRSEAERTSARTWLTATSGNHQTSSALVSDRSRLLYPRRHLAGAVYLFVLHGDPAIGRAGVAVFLEIAVLGRWMVKRPRKD